MCNSIISCVLTTYWFRSHLSPSIALTEQSLKEMVASDSAATSSASAWTASCYRFLDVSISFHYFQRSCYTLTYLKQVATSFSSSSAENNFSCVTLAPNLHLRLWVYIGLMESSSHK